MTVFNGLRRKLANMLRKTLGRLDPPSQFDLNEVFDAKFEKEMQEILDSLENHGCWESPRHRERRMKMN